MLQVIDSTINFKTDEKKNRIQILSIIKLFFGAFKAKDVWDHIIF